ncbi:MAG: dTDP-4-dehydrorhamnose reductase, partial [Chloroflexi bacterium]|nr:dTDP-4-dehydrorhamnose reductase [Chloroflexota bacterium]
MNLLLLGNTGQLGWELQRTLQPLGVVVALDYPEINMADAASIRKTVQEHRPEVIVNATAYTAVDKAESEPELAEAINGTGPGVLAEEARKLKAVLVHYSTDYVFDGTKGAPYMETDLPHPLNVYGESKLAGEQAIQSVDGAYLIMRTAWVYSMRRDSFVSKVLGWARKNETLRIVDDQISNPTWCRTLAEISAQILASGIDYIRGRTGLYHLAGDGYASRFEWARLILELDPNRHAQMVKEFLPAPTS